MKKLLCAGVGAFAVVCGADMQRAYRELGRKLMADLKPRVVYQ